MSVLILLIIGAISSMYIVSGLAMVVWGIGSLIADLFKGR